MVNETGGILYVQTIIPRVPPPRQDLNISRVLGLNLFAKQTLKNLFTYSLIYFPKNAFTLPEGTTHVDTLHKQRKIAFTLAEILITLGIIGVVAALTIPNLVTKYRKHVVETKLKKTYSILYNALNQSESDNGNLQYPAIELWDKDTWYSGTVFSDKYIYPYLNIIQRSSTIDVFRNKTVFLTDGTSIKYQGLFYQWPHDKDAPLILGEFFVGFVNNNEKTIAGKNYFRLDWGYAQQGKSKLVLLPIYRGGDYISKCGDDAIKTDCEEGNPATCAKMIICNDWKIPDDYPIKF